MQNNKNIKKKFNPYWIYAIILILLFVYALTDNQTQEKDISESEFWTMVEKGHIDKVNIYDKKRVEVFIKSDTLKKEGYKDKAESPLGGVNPGPHYSFHLLSVDEFAKSVKVLDQKSKAKSFKIFNKESSNIFGPLSYVLMILFLLGFWLFVMRRIGGGGAGPGSQIFNIGRSKATLFDNDAKVNVTFKDVAGLDEAKEEVMEIVDFLRSPQKYTSLGGKIPKGVLLVGPPGTGKTLLGKAVAGEANVPFFSISGSDFVEMFVGVGASRVRDLFRQAREKAPCIIFIDEIDAIGRARGRGSMQGNDERENTLNQLLVEMDGFTTDKGVIMMAATNRPDILDKALLRPGRFDRQIGIGKPDLNGREQIFRVHLKPIKIANDVDAQKLATQTPGFAGAELANICNEAALIAARRNKKAVDMDDFNYAIDRAIGGLERKNKLISPSEKKIIAYHEAGHAISGWYLEHTDPLVKVTIVPRGLSTLGYAQYLPKERYIERTERMLDQICGLLAGRAAEDLIFGKISTGAQNDLDRVTQTAYSLITVYGMNKEVGNVSYYAMTQDNQFAKPYSEQTAQLIDKEVRKIIDTQYQRALNLLQIRRHELELLAQELLDKEVLIKDDVVRLIGASPFKNKSETPETNHQNSNPEENTTSVNLEERNTDSE